jgi:hypothetical protein
MEIPAAWRIPKILSEDRFNDEGNLTVPLRRGFGARFKPEPQIVELMCFGVVPEGSSIRKTCLSSAAEVYNSTIN